MLKRLFHIYPGEGKSASALAFLGFLWSVAISLGWKNADAFFLLQIGADQLPTAYGLIATLMIAIASLMLYAYNRFDIYKIFLSLLSLGLLYYGFVFYCLTFHNLTESPWFWYLWRIMGWILFSVTNTGFWTFIDQFYHLSDSKRLFALFSSAIFVGIAVTGIIMNQGWLSLQETVFAILVLLSASILWTGSISKKLKPLQGEYDIEYSPPTQHLSLSKILQGVLKSKFTLCLMALNFLSFVSLFLTEFNYMQSFQNAFNEVPTLAFEGDEEAPLTLFLGKCIAFVNIFNILFGVLIYSRLVRKLGVNALLLTTPSLLLFTYLGWPMGPGLFFPLTAYFVCESTYFVIDDNNFNLLLNGVPSKLKYRIRVCIESFFEPIGTLGCAILLFLFPSSTIMLGLILAFLMLAASLVVRKLYPKAIYQNLLENALHFEKTAHEWLPQLTKKEKKGCLSRLFAILKSGHLSDQAFAIEGLLQLCDNAGLDKFLTLLEGAEPEVKRVFIEKLEGSSFANSPSVINRLIGWDHEGIEGEMPFKSTLHFFLAKRGLLPPYRALADLKSLDPKLQSAALVALKKSSGFSTPYSATELKTMAAQHVQDLLASEEVEKNLIGLEVISVDAAVEEINILIPFLSHPYPEVARNTAKAISEIASPLAARYGSQLLPSLFSLSDPQIRIYLIRAIGKFGDPEMLEPLIAFSPHFRPNENRMVEAIGHQMGLKIVPAMLSWVKDTKAHDRSRLVAGKILGLIALPQLRANLFDLLSMEKKRAYFYFYHYHTFKGSSKGSEEQLLRDTLLTGYHSVMDFIIQLLAIAGEVEAPEMLSRSLRSQNPKVRSQVIEMLERTCEPPLFRLIQPLIEEIPVYEKLKGAYMNEFELPELLDELSDSSSLLNQIVASAVSCHLQLPNWKTRLKSQMKGKDPIFCHFAYELLEST